MFLFRGRDDRSPMTDRPLHRENAPLASPAAMHAGTPAVSMEELHELRVRIPVDLHRQLLSLKVLRGRSLAETVSLALDIYFAERAAPVIDPSGRDEAPIEN